MERRWLGPDSVPDCGLWHSTTGGGGNTSPASSRRSYQKWVGQTPPPSFPCMPVQEGECSNPHPEMRISKLYSSTSKYLSQEKCLQQNSPISPPLPKHQQPNTTQCDPLNVIILHVQRTIYVGWLSSLANCMCNCGTYREGSGELSDSGSGRAAVPEVEAKHPLPVEATADIHSLPSLPLFVSVPHHETCQESIETESGAGDVLLYLEEKTERKEQTVYSGMYLQQMTS